MYIACSWKWKLFSPVYIGLLYFGPNWISIRDLPSLHVNISKQPGLFSVLSWFCMVWDTPILFIAILINGCSCLADGTLPSLGCKLIALFISCCLQEDLTVEDTKSILDDLIAGRKPTPGPRWEPRLFSSSSLRSQSIIKQRWLHFLGLSCYESWHPMGIST